jgi:hypothetical protein
VANTQAICTSFKVQLLTGTHALGTPPTRNPGATDTIKASLHYASGSLGAGTTTFDGAGNEVTGTNYTTGGVTVTNGTAPTNTSTTAHWTPSASIVYTTVTINSATFDCVLLYNSTQSNKAIAVYTFGAQTITAGTFTLTMPTNDGTTGLLRLA